MKTKRRQWIALLSAAALSATLLAGCSGGAPQDLNDGGVSAADLANEMKEKYADSETVSYTDGKFQIARDESFLVQYDFDPIAAGMESYPQIAALYADQALTVEIPATYDWADDDKKSYTISPATSPRTAISKSGLDASTPGYDVDGRFLFDRGEGQDWGNYGTMYLAQWVDLETGETLDKPIVSVVTIKGELDTPEVRMTATDDGVGEFTWNAVSGATDYLILQIIAYEDGSTGQALVIGQTDKTSWSEDVAQDTMTGTTWRANSRFANYLISEDDWLSDATVSTYGTKYDPADGAVPIDEDVHPYYTVVAVNDTGTSMFGKVFSGDEIAAQLPCTVATNMEKQSENGFSSYVDGVGMMPAYRWIVLCDGSLAQRLVNYDMDHITQDTETIYSYENDDMSDMTAESVSVLKVPYTVEGTPFSGTLTVENYDTAQYQSQLDSIAARQESLRSHSGTVERGISVQSDNSDEEPAEEENSSDFVVARTDSITANSALSEYLATTMISSMSEIDLSAFPEASDPEYLADAWAEAVYQNPLVLGVSGAAISSDRKTLYVEYEEDADTRTQQQDALRTATKEISEKIITSDMSALEKEYAINQYLCDNGEYDNAALENAEANDFQYVDPEYYNSFTAYGILVNHVGVCASYSAAFKMLADAAGLDSVVVTGYLEGSVPHAWNRVNLDGNWDTIDVTNNDMDYLPNALVNLPDSALSSVLVEDDRYAINSVLGAYVSTDTESEYYRVTGDYYSTDEIAAEFARRLESESTVVLRTDYALTDEQFYEIGGKIVSLTGNANLGGCYWMGVMLITSDTQ